MFYSVTTIPASDSDFQFSNMVDPLNKTIYSKHWLQPFSIKFLSFVSMVGLFKVIPSSWHLIWGQKPFLTKNGFKIIFFLLDSEKKRKISQVDRQPNSKSATTCNFIFKKSNQTKKLKIKLWQPSNGIKLGCIKTAWPRMWKNVVFLFKEVRPKNCSLNETKINS